LSLAVLTFTLAVLFISAPLASGSGPGFPLLLSGNVTYADGSPAQNVEVRVENEESGESLSKRTDEKGRWSIEVSPIAGYGDEVLIIAKDEWNNEVSRSANVSIEPQRINLKFDVPMPSGGDGSNGGNGKTSGGDTFTPTPTTTPTPTPAPTLTPTPTVTSPSPSPSSLTEIPESGTKPEQGQEQGAEGKTNLPIPVLDGVSVGVVGIVIAVALVTVLVRRKHKKV